MPAWALRAVLPSGASYNGQMVHDMTSLTIPNTFKKYVQQVSFDIPGGVLDKYSGFETKKFRVQNDTGVKLAGSVNIMMVGNLDKWMQFHLVSLAKGCNGCGMHIEFYDDWMTDTQYTGRWVNAGDFVDTSEILCGASIDLQIFDMQGIS